MSAISKRVGDGCMNKQWFATSITAPDGTARKCLVLGKGETETDAYLAAKSQAQLRAFAEDDSAHLHAGSHTIAELQEHPRPY